MKKLFSLVIVAIVFAAAGCSEGDMYDDTALRNDVTDLQNRVAKLEQLCNEMNSNISALQSIVAALQSSDYITSMAPIMDGGREVGYTITFAKGGTITIYHGQDGKDGADGANGADGKDGVDGKDGYTPVIGVRQDSDGVYYWTLDGEWLTDDAGNKIKAVGTDGAKGDKGDQGEQGPAGEKGDKGDTGEQGPAGDKGDKGDTGEQGPAGENGDKGDTGEQGPAGENGADGKDGITPMLKIENDYWYISYDNGTTWTELGKATGEDGKDGADGVDGTPGQDGTDGDSMFAGVDYTTSTDYVIITLTDGTEIKLPTWAAFEALQRLCNEMNTNISALQTVVSSLEQNDYITSVNPFIDNGTVIGYTIEFAKNPSIVIYHGKDGASGSNGSDGSTAAAPVIGVRQDTDGRYYWTLDGRWLTDDAGNKICAQGLDGKDGADGETGADGAPGNDGTAGADGAAGITPQLKIENGYWFVSYDEGESWTEVGKATGEDGADGANGTNGKDGDSVFASIDMSSLEYVIFTLVDGTVIKVPTWAAFEALQIRCNEMNTTIEAIEALLATIESRDYITDIDPYVEEGLVVGYIIKFYKSAPVVIYNNVNPVIAVRKDDNGFYYWTLDGEWLLDADGNRIPAQTEEHVIPQVKAENGYWMVSTDCGQTWSQFCEVTEESFRVVDGIGITQDDKYVYFTLPNGTVLSIPKSDSWQEHEHITFADSEVEALCVANWDTNGDKGLSPAEAAAVTSLNAVFKGNTAITSFNELQYFTGLLAINSNAFSGCTNLGAVTLPESLIGLNDHAFAYCSNLVSITLPDAIASIGLNAFGKCSKLNSVKMPASLTDIQAGAFSNCSSLAKIELPANLTTIGQDAFYYCTMLSTIVIPSKVTTIGSNAFCYCTNLMNITIPASVTSIGDRAFVGCTQLIRVDIDSLMSWCNIEFASEEANPLYCAKRLYENGSLITDLTIPEGVTTIKPYAFRNAALNTVNIPDHIVTIGDSAFSGCTTSSITIGDGVQQIGWSAFNGCTASSVTLGNNIHSIGSHAFQHCHQLTRVDINSLKSWCNIEFGGELANPLYYAKRLYENGSLITDLTIPEGVDVVKSYAFFNAELNSIDIPDHILTINGYAFNGSTATSVTFGNSISKVEAHAFENCNQLTCVNINSLEAWCGIQFLSDCANPLVKAGKLYVDGSLLTDLIIPDGVEIVRNHTFHNATCLKSITIPDHVLEIGIQSFKDCTAVTNISFGKNLNVIGNHAFENANSVKNFELSDSVVSIGESCFSNCDILTSFTFGENIKSIGKYAFSYSTNLSSLYIKAITPPSLSIYVFHDVPSYMKVYVPAEAVDAYNDDWSGMNLVAYDFEKGEVVPEVEDDTTTEAIL